MDPGKKRAVLRSFSNGVYILTSKSGDRYGAATVTWVTQASFNPPLLMAAVRRDSNAFKCLSESRVAAVHVLGADQAEMAQRFFTPTAVNGTVINGEPFSYRVTSAPILTNPPAYVECYIRQTVEAGGDHALVVLEVVEAEFRKGFEPLTIRESPWEYGG